MHACFTSVQLSCDRGTCEAPSPCSLITNEHNFVSVQPHHLLQPLQVALPTMKHWSIPDDLAAIKTYLAFIKALPAWKSTDYGEASILEGWSKHH